MILPTSFCLLNRNSLNYNSVNHSSVNHNLAKYSLLNYDLLYCDLTPFPLPDPSCTESQQAIGIVKRIVTAGFRDKSSELSQLNTLVDKAFGL